MLGANNMARMLANSCNAICAESWDAEELVADGASDIGDGMAV